MSFWSTLAIHPIFLNQSSEIKDRRPMQSGFIRQHFDDYIEVPCSGKKRRAVCLAVPVKGDTRQALPSKRARPTPNKERFSPDPSIRRPRSLRMRMRIAANDTKQTDPFPYAISWIEVIMAWMRSFLNHHPHLGDRLCNAFPLDQNMMCQPNIWRNVDEALARVAEQAPLIGTGLKTIPGFYWYFKEILRPVAVDRQRELWRGFPFYWKDQADYPTLEDGQWEDPMDGSPPPPEMDDVEFSIPRSDPTPATDPFGPHQFWMSELLDSKALFRAVLAARHWSPSSTQAFNPFRSTRANGPFGPHFLFMGELLDSKAIFHSTFAARVALTANLNTAVVPPPQPQMSAGALQPTGPPPLAALSMAVVPGASTLPFNPPAITPAVAAYRPSSEGNIKHTEGTVTIRPPPSTQPDTTVQPVLRLSSPLPPLLPLPTATPVHKDISVANNTQAVLPLSSAAGIPKGSVKIWSMKSAGTKPHTSPPPLAGAPHGTQTTVPQPVPVPNDVVSPMSGPAHPNSLKCVIKLSRQKTATSDAPALPFTASRAPSSLNNASSSVAGPAIRFDIDSIAETVAGPAVELAPSIINPIRPDLEMKNAGPSQISVDNLRSTPHRTKGKGSMKAVEEQSVDELLGSEVDNSTSTRALPPAPVFEDEQLKIAPLPRRRAFTAAAGKSSIDLPAEVLGQQAGSHLPSLKDCQ